MTLTLPSVPTQAGLRRTLQAAVFPVGGSFGVTNGVDLTLGY